MKLIKVPFSAGGLGKTKGCELAPDAVEKEMKNSFLNEFGFKQDLAVESIPVDNSNIETTNRNIFEYLMQNEDIPILVGGDHSITYSAFKAFAKQFPNPGIIVFDAHPDLENNFSPPSHEDYLRVLIEEGIVKRENVLIVGVRDFSSNELNFIKENRIKSFSMRQISFEGKLEVCDSIMEIARNIESLYLSIDIDSVDPAFAPGTGYISPGGLTSRELLYFIQRLMNLRNIKMFDIVEINPSKDSNNLTVMLGAKIIRELFLRNKQ